MEAPEHARRWHDESNNIVILSIPTEDDLLAVMDRAWLEGIRYVPFTEPDLDDEHTAVALAPCEASQRLCSNLPLALREVAVA
jgi:hypothetical protein